MFNIKGRVSRSYTPTVDTVRNMLPYTHSSSIRVAAASAMGIRKGAFSTRSSSWPQRGQSA